MAVNEASLFTRTRSRSREAGPSKRSNPAIHFDVIRIFQRTYVG